MKFGGNHLVLANLRDDYPQLVQHVRENGAPVSVRGKLTYELRNVLLTLQDPYDALPLGVGRKLNLGIAAAEALQLVAGITDPQLMLKVQARFSDYMDGSALHGAYGPRLRWQLAGIERLIRLDPTTRQAVMTIWDPAYDQSVPTAPRDLPCTIALQFLYRDEKLELHTTMRSNDVVLGLSYDLFQFTQLQLAMANVLQIEPGSYYHHAVSLHLYGSDTGVLDYLQPTDVLTRPTDLPRGLEAASWDELATRARFLLDVATGRLDSSAVNFEVFTPTEAWYLKQLVKHTEVVTPYG